jgi:hypothetical protein
MASELVDKAPAVAMECTESVGLPTGLVSSVSASELALEFKASVERPTDPGSRDTELPSVLESTALVGIQELASTVSAVRQVESADRSLARARATAFPPRPEPLEASALRELEVPRAETALVSRGPVVWTTATVFKVSALGLVSVELSLVAMEHQSSTTIAPEFRHSVARMLPRWVALVIAAA